MFHNELRKMLVIFTHKYIHQMLILSQLHSFCIHARILNDPVQLTSYCSLSSFLVAFLPASPSMAIAQIFYPALQRNLT